MEDATADLISMADIARLAGQSRATVGNWKRREVDFPVEYSYGPRGPLYDRSVIEAWLTEKGRLSSALQGEFEVFQVMDRLRGDAAVEDIALTVFVLLALRTAVSDSGWADLAAQSGENQFEALKRAVHDNVPVASDLISSSRINPQVIAGCIDAVTQIGTGNLAATADSVLDTLFDRSGRKWGEWSTSSSLRSLMVAVAGWGKTVYDPAAGAGRLLVDMAYPETLNPQRLFGQELAADANAIAQLNLMVHGLEGRIETGDVLADDKLADLRFDRVVADPPWNTRVLADTVRSDDLRWIWGDPSSSDATMAWIQHCLFHLNDGGRAVVVVPPRVLFATGRPALPMQAIIKSGLLDAVIGLPAGLLAASSASAALLVFVKGRPMESGRPAPTLMINIEDDRAQGTGRVKSLPPELVSEVREIYGHWQEGLETVSPMVGVAEYEDLAKYDFDLTPRRYIDTPSATHDPVQLAKAHLVLSAKVATALAACGRADAELLALLKGER